MENCLNSDYMVCIMMLMAYSANPIIFSVKVTYLKINC